MPIADVPPESHGARDVPAMDESEIDDLEASYEWRDDAPAVRRRLLEQLPDTASTWVRRARLILLGVDELVRDHGAAKAATVLVAIRDRATASGHRAVQARASWALSWLFRSVGDPSVALEHAVAALALDGDDLDAALRCRMRLVLADALDESGSSDAARPRYREALEHASSVSTPWLSVMVVNNWAWVELVAGHLEASAELVEQMQAIARKHDAPLNLGAAGTVAEVLHARGRSTEAVAMLRQRLHEDRRQAPISAAGCWLTLAQIQRDTGDLDAAEASLDVADRLTTTHAIHVLEVEAIGSRAELLAARGDHAGAYEMHCRFHAQTLELRSAASDARAQTLHATFEVDQARHDSALYRELSCRDPLTGLYNRRHLDEDLDRRLTQGEDLAIAMVDLDHFKRVNDTCSHEAGDAVLVRLAALLDDATAAAHAEAYAARLGGEEFLLVLPGHGTPAARAVAETLRRTIAATDWTDIAPRAPVTASIGLASSPDAGRAPLERAGLLREADRQVYAAKDAGRDRVEPAARPAACPTDPSRPTVLAHADDGRR